MGEAGGEDEGRSFDRDDDVGLEEAGDVFDIGRAQGGRHGLLNGGQADDNDGFRIVEGGRGVEAEVELLGLPGGR